MAKYRVHMVETTITYAYRDVEAESENDAADIVEADRLTADEGWIISPRSSAERYIDWMEGVE